MLEEQSRLPSKHKYIFNAFLNRYHIKIIKTIRHYFYHAKIHNKSETFGLSG